LTWPTSLKSQFNLDQRLEQADFCRLDFAENAALSVANQNKKSYNLDDTGFFSLQTLERALQVWDLTLVRWRGEAMKPYQDRPESVTQC
jgi:ataxin-3